MVKRKRSAAAVSGVSKETPIPLPKGTSKKLISPTPIALPSESTPSNLSRRSLRRSVGAAKPNINPDENSQILDGPDALRASPDGDVNDAIASKNVKKEDTRLPDLSEPPEDLEKPATKKVKLASKSKATRTTLPVSTELTKVPKKENTIASMDADAEDIGEADAEELTEALSRPPPVNSSYLPLPWKGRIGYACLNTYLRESYPPVFSSRTCRIASIIEHRHPLADPSQPEHATKNRPNRELPADIRRGQQYVEEIGKANARDIPKMIRWNDKYGIKFMRLSSEMFPFASHEEYGYKLAPFASEVLAEAGKVIAQLGHRVTMHPGQFTQLGSPRKSVIENSFRDLDFHDELLTLLKLPEQENKDAVLILHMGGMFGDKGETLDRFRTNYAKLSQSVKNRIVLENDDVIWTVHDLLPVCEEMNIPLCLDFHHHNIMFDKDQIREGTLDIMELFPRIEATWKRKGIRQKMHYSEPTPPAITGRQRRKHSPRVMTLPPCAPTMDLMIEAKDKEQAVFELMRTFKLPGYERFNDIIPYVRNDHNKPVRAAKKKTPKKKKGKATEEDDDPEDEPEEASERSPVPEEEVGMGGPEGRVYWPPGMEEWLRPKKREVKKKEDADGKPTPAMKAAATKARKAAAAVAVAEIKAEAAETVETPVKPKKTPPPPKKVALSKKTAKAVPTPSTSEGEDLVSEPPSEISMDEAPPVKAAPASGKPAPKRPSRRSTKTDISYAEED